MSHQPDSTFAMLLPDGQWANICTRLTHGGDRQAIAPVSLNQATVMQRYLWRKWEKEGVLVEVKETRTVTIVPGGAA